MKTKTTARYHLLLLRMAIIKISTNNKCWRGCGKREPSSMLMGLVIEARSDAVKSNIV